MDLANVFCKVLPVVFLPLGDVIPHAATLTCLIDEDLSIALQGRRYFVEHGFPHPLSPGRQSLSLDLSALSLGDKVKILRQGGGRNGSGGLELADIDFYVIPEPSFPAGFLVRARLDGGHGAGAMQRPRGEPPESPPENNGKSGL